MERLLKYVFTLTWFADTLVKCLYVLYRTLYVYFNVLIDCSDQLILEYSTLSGVLSVKTQRNLTNCCIKDGII